MRLLCRVIAGTHGLSHHDFAIQQEQPSSEDIAVGSCNQETQSRASCVRRDEPVRCDASQISKLENELCLHGRRCWDRPVIVVLVSNITVRVH
jgi:hypothetical protein